MAPPSKKRKQSQAAIEEILFDPSARQDYLAGFHKRKQQRIKNAQEAAIKREKAEKAEDRKKLREGRKLEMERHVEAFNALLRESGEKESGSDDQGDSEDEEWGGFEEPPAIDHEAEYIDEDRYTTVTVKDMDLSKIDQSSSDEDEGENSEHEGKHVQKGNVAEKASGVNKPGKRTWTKEKPEQPKKKKKKFRYESKAERQSTRRKERASNKAQAKARRG
ncbi:hypothetical protein L228DRAFT_243376 [Xylona heveae TC161]|uniref:Protein required for cell viability Rrp17 n=1 Tax=Xylona heveae (strain CBS 132557 / TC161) TaxID=1328760 RepID=A0A165K0H2_XYLHT|nr:hypothetical protein L228DRAFT_243376 [Xylona heveae TC161]KZF26850.1 hypothetical protein L228DRAFT_243376 [Xylona heveae TC161]